MGFDELTVLVGYKRSGTTFLRGYFSEHPEIEWRRVGYYLLGAADPDPQEYRRLLGDEGAPTGHLIDVCEHLALGLIHNDQEKWQALRFQPDAACDDGVIRIDPVEAARRVKRVAPDARILIVIRNQIDWLQTHYRAFFSELPRGRQSWPDFATTLERRLVLDGGRYDAAIATYRELFDQDRVHVLLLEELRDELESCLRALCAFLGVDYVPYDITRAPHNKGPENADVRLARLAGTLPSWRPLRTLVRTMGTPARTWIRRRISKRDLLTEDEKRVLAAFYAASNRRTERLIGKDLGRFGYPL